MISETKKNILKVFHAIQVRAFMISSNTDRQTDVTKDLSFETWKLMHVQDKDQRVVQRQKNEETPYSTPIFLYFIISFPAKKVLVSGHDM